MYIDTFVAFVSEFVVFSMLFHLYISFIALKLGHLLMLLLLFDDVDDTASSWLSLLSHQITNGVLWMLLHFFERVKRMVKSEGMLLISPGWS